MKNQNIYLAVCGFVIIISLLIVNYQYLQSPMVIYVAGKYSGDVVNNTANAVYMGSLVQKHTCNFVIVPHLWGSVVGDIIGYNYSQWMKYDRIGINHSDALFKISSSPGADNEEQYAKSIGKPIYYSLSDIPNRC